MLDTTRDARQARRIAHTMLLWRAVALVSGQTGKRNYARGRLPFLLRHDPEFVFRHGVLWVDRWRKRRGEIDKHEYGHPYGRRG